ncbi:hypothetical protein PPL_00832 [Heterostelium album PN500]|uniref:RRM domain-containing protein n=1 Tax=Heterostelium pallidum (strain ATCC 26659 / Pp 5 / PN500) TaxID=670386 RepID=D3AXK1_HETP5|nr:hypothetical protein PPL_00832 [Heterostelium album PN500]EFA86270.1 hypothetical protein PPL_00832 [Heterostelium album PN500]|eukprot:XP_020438375.1 hypothetical protein PPL_00832 [Heterostelium album PN500]
MDQFTVNESSASNNTTNGGGSGDNNSSSDNELEKNSAFHLHGLSKDVDESDGEAHSDDEDEDESVDSSPLDHDKGKNKSIHNQTLNRNNNSSNSSTPSTKHNRSGSTTTTTTTTTTTPPLSHTHNNHSNSANNTNNIDVPLSRIFIICGKDISEAQLTKVFKKFGTIESCKLVIDKETNESKGLAYIKYQKASSAALAIESMNGTTIPENESTPLKVMIAEAKGQKTKTPVSTDPEDFPPNSRLFVICRKDTSEADLTNRFKQFGNLEHVKIVRERDTNESKGCAFVKFSKSSTAALAMESINESDDKSTKAIIAQPKVKYHKQNESIHMVQFPMMGPNPYPFQTEFSNPYGLFPTLTRQRLFVVCHKSVTQEGLYKLFSRYPGMEYCDLKKDKVSNKSKGFAYVNYSTPQAALLAKNELNGIKYPPGYSLKVVFAEPLGIKQNPTPVIDPISSIQTSFAQMPFIARRNSSNDTRKRQKI